MHIFQINASYKPAYIYGGPTMSVSKLSEELVKAGQDVSVLTTTANGLIELDLKPGELQLVDNVPVIYFKRLTKDHSHFSPALFSHLFKKLNKSINQQIIHIHAWWNLVSMISCFISLWKQKQVILSPRGTLSSYSFKNRSSILKNTFHTLAGKHLLKRCHFHVTSEKEKQDILNLLIPKSITVIPNFVRLEAESAICKTEQVSQNESQISNPIKLLFLSRIEEKKGLDLLFNALVNFHIPYTLTVAGSGHSEYIVQLKQLASKLGIDQHIAWIGQQGSEKKFSILHCHDLLVLPSHDENFANVVIESLSVGTAVLISKKVGLADYVAKHDLGWISDITAVELRQTIDIASKDFEKRELIRQNAPQKIRNDFNDDQLVKRYIEMYETALANS